MKRTAVTAFCSLLLASISFAQSVDGEWTTPLRTREPERETITLTLRSNGSELTGTVHAIQPIPLEGTIEGNSLRIQIKVPTNTGGELRVSYTAILEGDEINFTYQSETGRPPVFGPAAQEFTARRLIP